MRAHVRRSYSGVQSRWHGANASAHPYAPSIDLPWRRRMQSKAGQGPLACGLVLMLAATVPAVPTAAIKRHRSLEPSVQQEMGGLLPDEERHADDCTKPAPHNKCPRYVSEDCNYFYISELKKGKLEAVMCRNPSGWLGLDKNNGETRNCERRSEGRGFDKKRKVCPGDKKSLRNPAFLVWAAQRGDDDAVRTLVAEGFICSPSCSCCPCRRSCTRR